MLVIMNADASAGVQVEARVGAEFPALGGIGWGLLIGGVLVTLIAVLLLVLAVRTPRDRRPPAPPAGYAVPAPRGPTGQEFWGPGPTVGPAPGREPGSPAS